VLFSVPLTITALVASVSPQAQFEAALATASAPALGPQLASNGGFDNGLDGWRVNDPAAQSLVHTDAGHTNSGAALVRASSGGVGVLNNRVNTKTDSTSRVYHVRAWVRSTGPRISGHLRVRQVYSGASTSTHQTGFTAEGDSWTLVKLQLETAAAQEGSLDVNAVAYGLSDGSGFYVDDVSIRAEYTTAIAPPVGSCISTPLGIPTSDQGALFGAAVTGTSQLDVREAQFGQSLGLHRSYYQGNQVDSAIRTVRDDHANGRLPWISFKLPYSWTEMANGRGDAWALDLARKLDATTKPVWLAFHHEPEKEGDIGEWTRLQRRLAPIIHANSDNVAVSIIVTGWNQFYGPSQFSLDSIWPGDQNVDIVGLDPYNWYGSVKNGVVETDWDELKPYFEKMASFARARGVEWAIAETAYSHEAAARDPLWLDRSFNDMEQAGGIGMAYFDSSLHSTARWTLDVPSKVTRFRAILASSTRIC
jgi:hypothetical protein